MEWLKNPKNQPIVIAVLVAIILAVGVFYYFKFIKAPSGGDTAPAATAPDATAPAGGTAPSTGPAAAPVGTAPAAATAPAASAPGATAAPAGATAPAGSAAPAAATTPAAAATQVASVTPMETWRGDPFQPIGYKPVKKAAHIAPPIRDFPFMTLPGIHVKKRDIEASVPEIQQPPRRMAGILLNDRVYAIIESNGGSEVVQPGDYLKDRLAMVQKIEPDKVVLKTVDKKPRYITVRMAASAHQANSGPSSVAAPSPGGMAIRPPRPSPAMAPGLGPPP